MLNKFRKNISCHSIFFLLFFFFLYWWKPLWEEKWAILTDCMTNYQQCDSISWLIVLFIFIYYFSFYGQDCMTILIVFHLSLSVLTFSCWWASLFEMISDFITLTVCMQLCIHLCTHYSCLIHTNLSLLWLWNKYHKKEQTHSIF